MYNEELKERFAKSYTEKPTVRTYCRRLFDISQQYEEARGADLYTMGAKDIEVIVAKASGISTQSIVANLTLAKAYVRWCIEQGFPDVCNEILQTVSVASDKIKTETVTSPSHLQRYLDSVFQPEDNNTIDIVYRTYFWLAYAGVYLDDIFKITNDNISFEDMTIKYGGMDYPIYREGLKAIRKCVTLEQIVVYNPNRSKPMIFGRVKSNLLMRGIRSVLSRTTVRENISHKQSEAISTGKANIKMGFFKVWLSGLFYRTYMEELAGVKPDFATIVRRVEIAKQTKNSAGVINRHAKQYYEDYLLWKSLLNK